MSFLQPVAWVELMRKYARWAQTFRASYDSVDHICSEIGDRPAVESIQ